MKLVRVGSLVVVVLVGLGITTWFVSRSYLPMASGAFQSSAAGHSWVGTALTAGYGFGITLIGVALGATYRRLVRLRSGGTERVAPGKLIVDILSSIDFQIGLVGSPL